MAKEKETSLGTEVVAEVLPPLPANPVKRLLALAAGHPEAKYRYESASSDTIKALFAVHGDAKVKPFRLAKATVGDVIARLGTEKKS